MMLPRVFEENGTLFLISLPVINERQNLHELIPKLLEDSRLDIFIIDDASDDGTHELIIEMQKQHGSRIHYVRRFTNLGFASAHKESIAYFLSNEKYDALLQMDADQSHRVEDVPRILEKFGNDDLVIGSRYINEGAVVGWPIRRLLLSRTANLLCRILLKIEVFDATSGFRLLSRRLCHQVLNNSSEVKGYFFQIETVLSASRMKYKISEVPITFVERMSGHSKLTTKNVFEAFVSLCKMRNY